MSLPEADTILVCTTRSLPTVVIVGKSSKRSPL